MKVWLLQADDRWRTDIANALTAASDIEVTASFHSGHAALMALDDNADFDAALVDMVLPDLPGQHVIGALTRARPDAAVIALTNVSDDEAVFGALAAGALGYLLKDGSSSGLADALRLASVGGAPLTPSIGRRVVSRFRCPPARQPLVSLTPREHDVLELLCSGSSYRETAGLLGIAQGTVQTYVKSLYDKLGVCSKAEAVRMAYEAALIAPRRA